MDLDELEALEGAHFDDESSASAYEASDDEQNSSHDGDSEVAPTSRAGTGKGRGSNVAKNHVKYMRRTSPSRSEGGSNPSPDRRRMSEDIEDQICENADEWAANFQAPSLDDIRTPERQSRSRPKRKAKPATKTRVKRLKSFLNNDYRDLLNTEIQDAASRTAPNYGLKPSQIGSSSWTAAEKDAFFLSLDRLGRDNTRGIADRIGSKSQHQVQEYVNLLHEGIMKRKELDYQLLAPTELPAAVQVSDECVVLLERAGDALAARHELAEEKVEKAKWGDSWLITEDVAHLMESRRRQPAGEEDMEEVLPAANLLDLKNWLELSHRVFMNPTVPREEDNWQAIAEPGETPAIRATAFEDFHSLTVSITKRLASTALFCAMSRLRAKDSNKTKRAVVNVEDVEAAVNILKMRPNSNDFWITSATRCGLHVVGDDETTTMTYEQVEKALREELSRTPRSRSVGRQPQPRASSQASTHRETRYSSVSETSDRSSESGSMYASLPNSDEEYMSSPPLESTTSSSHSLPYSGPPKRNIDPLKAQKSAERALDAYTEAFDLYASQTEEIRLWSLLKQTAPLDFDLEPVSGQVPKFPRDALAERDSWRTHVNYLSEWETTCTPVMEEDFVRNRKRLSKMEKLRTARAESGINDDLGEGRSGDERSEDEVDPGSDGHEDFVNFDEEDNQENIEDRRFQVESLRPDPGLADAISNRQLASSDDEDDHRIKLE